MKVDNSRHDCENSAKLIKDVRVEMYLGGEIIWRNIKLYRVPCDKRGLNYDKYFTRGNTERTKLNGFNSNNTKLLTVDETKGKIASLTYILRGIKEG